LILDSLEVPAERFARGTGWDVKERGACRGELCVPLPEGSLDAGVVRVEPVAAALGMPLVHDADAGLWAVGPATLGGRALPTAAAPEVTLPDRDGTPFSTSSLAGRKVLLVAWASW
jgi:hypothetical protein